MARLLVVGADLTPQDRAVLQTVTTTLRDTGHEARLPSAAPAAVDVVRQLQSVDAVVAVLDHLAPDGLLVLLGAARVMRRPILGLRSESTELAPGLRSLLQDLHVVHAWDASETQQALIGFAGGVRVFAGALVRDAVPKILKDEGRELRFRQVAESEYPHVLKRKLVETAQRLEEADFGVEQEEIAEVLELLETLINLRRYDRESLRSIKEGKWRKRGGFQKGFLLDEEPVLQSR